MEELGLKGGDSEVQPNSRTYCSVLDTLANSKNYKAFYESMDILKRMEGKIGYYPLEVEDVSAYSELPRLPFKTSTLKVMIQCDLVSGLIQ